MTRQALTGVHHVSAVSAHIGRTHAFYPGVLGMRPVIRTVNQDEPSMYHLFYGDGAGSPGSDVTVFDIPGAAREHRGNNSITRTNLRVNGERTLQWWADRFARLGVPHGRIAERGGRLVLDFEDPEATLLSLVDDAGTGSAFPWEEASVPAEHQVRGLGYTEITVPELGPTHDFLVHGLGLTMDRSYRVEGSPAHDVHVYRIGSGGTHAEVHVAERPGLARSRHGAGGVHHVALRVPEMDDINSWSDHLDDLGYRNSGVVDRHYFRSVYVREPGHVLFELATDGPGFEVDGPLDGERLSLPPFLEGRRAEIEERLKPIDKG